MKLEGKIGMVTGAGQGIGEAIALRFAKEGADVVVIDVNTDAAQKVVNKINDTGRRGLAIKADVTKSNEINEMVKEVLKEFGKIDFLVNNAGWDKIEPFVKSTEETWDKVIAINYKGQVICCRAVLDHMIERKNGRIINIASDAARVGSSGEAVYSGAKGGVMAFTKTLAREVARYNILVNCVCPGPTETPLVLNAIKASEQASKIAEGLKRAIPLGRMAQPPEIAGAVLFFASDDADYITGQTLSVSGGLSMV
ncbi:MAG: 3-oxoacyl-ACP reductase family protein [Thermodesulfobacteriota bacterium]|nr:3-oxoacyl-ACP reductase family protein [Thermodesulfobacteriota bacterium]